MTATNTTTTNGRTVSPEKLRKIMERVEHLLLIADDPRTMPTEAAVARQQAEAYMTQYRIDEANLDSVEKAKMGIRPTSAMWNVCRSDSEFDTQYRTLLAYVTNHVGAKCVLTYAWEDGSMVIHAEVFGFESDIAYGAMLWSGIRLAFGKRLEPTLDPTVDDIENVYRMRNAGMERIRIARVMGYGTTGSATAKVTKQFKQGCERHGEDSKVLLGKGNSVKNFRVNYAEAFVSEMWSRLYSLRTARGLDNAGTLVLASREDEVVEAMYQKYPHLRPRPIDPNAKPIKFRKGKAPKSIAYNDAAARRGRDAAKTVDLGPGAKGRLDA